MLKRCFLLCASLLWLAMPALAAAKTGRHHAVQHASAQTKAVKSARVAAKPQAARNANSAKRIRANHRRKIAHAPPRPAGRARHARARETRPMIVLDAGHGGYDPGAIGKAGTQEKTVTLATTMELARQLRATGRYRVALTRRNDNFVPLQKRLLASRGAAMFISIHADASVNGKARGASVYVRQAMYRGSAALQEKMIDNLDNDVQMRPMPARKARFHVLANAAAPSVLVEIGFISNRRDEMNLRRARYRATIAGAIRAAVEEHFANLRRASRG